MTYEQWIEYIFGHSNPPMNSPKGARLHQLAPIEAISLVTRIFTHCGTELARFSDGNLAKGLNFIGCSGESEWMYHVYDVKLPWPARAACIRSMIHLYRDCFARRCVTTINSDADIASPLDTVCFMWWDVFPSGGDVEHGKVDAELIGIMEAALQIPHDSCRKSALHGLGHWTDGNNPRINTIIDDWITYNPQLSPALLEYARNARTANVQ